MKNLTILISLAFLCPAIVLGEIIHVPGVQQNSTYHLMNCISDAGTATI